MADKEIRQLPEVTAPATNDWYVLQKASNNQTSKVSGANLLPDGVVSNDNLDTTAGEPGGAWQSWTPTLSGRFTDAKWNKTGKYIKVGKTVHFRLKLVANATTPMAGGSANAIFTLPVTSVDMVETAGYLVIGTGSYLDLGTASAVMYPVWKTTTTADVRPSPGTQVTSTVPFTWTIGDEIYVQGTYEAA